MRLELGSRVECTDGPLGRLADLVLDPAVNRLTHLVVEPDDAPRLARLLPLELVERDEAGETIRLSATLADVAALPVARATSERSPAAGDSGDAEWTVGVEEVVVVPYIPGYDIEPLPPDVALSYDRIPKDEVELRRASTVDSADGKRVGTVDGLVVDVEGRITSVVVVAGRPWRRRGLAIPIAGVAAVRTDAVTLALGKREASAQPVVRIRR